MNEPTQHICDKKYYTLYPLEKTWEESREYCKKRNSVLAYLLNIEAVNCMVDAMGDHPKGMSSKYLNFFEKTFTVNSLRYKIYTICY